MEKWGKLRKMGKMMKNEEKPEIGSRQGKERQQGTPSRNRKPETGNRKPETGNRKFWFLDSKPEFGFDSGSDLVRNGLRDCIGLCFFFAKNCFYFLARSCDVFLRGL